MSLRIEEPIVYAQYHDRGILRCAFRCDNIPGTDLPAMNNTVNGRFPCPIVNLFLSWRRPTGNGLWFGREEMFERIVA